MAFSFTELALPGVVVIEPDVYDDARGFFSETYKASAFAAAGLTEPFVQENFSRSVRGTLRGLHFQRAPQAQAKLVRVLTGEIFEVAVDLRPGAPTCGQWVSLTLSADSRRLLYVPPWCAHGYCVTSERADVLYKTTAEYAPAFEGGVAFDDPTLGIPWPVDAPVLSPRDRTWPALAAVIDALHAASRTGA